MKILVLSCDNYSYLWPTYFTLLDKYYPNHPEVYLSTETKKCELCKTINTNSQVWTERYRKAVEQIPDDYILVMLEDFFIRQPVNEEEINNIEKMMKTNSDIAVCNFELKYRDCLPTAYLNYDKQKNKQMYLNSCQPSLWNKEKLIERLQKPQTAWEWETSVIDSPYLNLINNTDKYIIDIGYRHQPLETGWGITRGEITKECVDFLKTEGLSIEKPHPILSIITPYYKALQYIKELVKTLEPQLTNEVEWIIIDDGCNEKFLDKIKAKVIHRKQNSGGASVPRNEGISIAKGDYIVFIDADDYVKSNYISTILNKIKTTDFDYCMFGWQGIGPLTVTVKIEDQAPEWNTSVWNCIYKKESIKNLKFDETLCIGEDAKFNEQARKGKKENILDILYIYRSGVKDGLTYKKEVYNKKYIPAPQEPIYENVFYFYKINEIGGVETFFYELAKKYHDRDITIFYRTGDSKQLERLKQYVRVIQFTGQKIKCKKAFFNYNMDIIDNVEAEEYYCIIHADFEHFKASPPPTNPKITHYLGVTQAVCDAFTRLTKKPCQKCYNPLDTSTGGRKILRLVSATRLTYEKGGKRIEQLAEALEKANIPYEWTIFSNRKDKIKNHNNIIFKDTQLDIYDTLRRADYVVQLSDTESFCYTMVEALSLGTPVIVCPWPCLKELGVNETNAFILPFDMKDVPVKEIYTKEFDFKYTPPQDTWGDVLTQTKGTYYDDVKKRYLVQATSAYKDLNLKDANLGYIPKKGQTWVVTKERLDYLLGGNPLNKRFVNLIKEVTE